MEIKKVFYNLEEKNVNLKNKINRLTFENDLLEGEMLSNEADVKYYYLVTAIVHLLFHLF